ncbi:unnamed protein product [Adineta ricciae]|uniref:Uncharacterized protein n=1 Tax=Adineta ricciae TaxID=249248 RepID=A0A816AG93_ADIRI|nr:unnamed protein product [Adineta ricciae]CAF1597706.1 unnamed protein product [Adineta ricciae]
MQPFVLAAFCPCNVLSMRQFFATICPQHSVRDQLSATICPATFCRATFCPCNVLSATICSRHFVMRHSVLAPSKFDLRYEDPFRIIKQKSPKTFIVQHIKKPTLQRQVTTDVLLPIFQRIY